MNDKTLEELRYYFNGYGSRHDETILKLMEQNERYRNLLESLNNTHNIASEIMKKHPEKMVINANDLLQYILRKINDELEEAE